MHVILLLFHMFYYCNTVRLTWLDRRPYNLYCVGADKTMLNPIQSHLVRLRPVWITNHPPSVLWRCWLGHQKNIVSEMTYILCRMGVEPYSKQIKC